MSGCTQVKSKVVCLDHTRKLDITKTKSCCTQKNEEKMLISLIVRKKMLIKRMVEWFSKKNPNHKSKLWCVFQNEKKRFETSFVTSNKTLS